MRVTSIPPSLPFLPTLAEEILSGRLLPGFPGPQADPLRLAALTVYVPTRRAGRTLAAAFSARLGGAAAILPRIRTLSEEDEQDSFLGPAADALLPAMTPLHRRLILARLIRFWKAQLAGAALDMFGDADIVLPASASDALWLAGDLATLMDEATDEGVDLAALARLDLEDRLTGWWQLTRTFLSIVTEHWPAELERLGLADAARLRLAGAERMAARLDAEGSAEPIVIAGALTTVGPTLSLMRAVAQLTNGAVVLPGLDTRLDDESFRAIALRAAPAAAGHPQYALSRMLAGMGIDRADVAEIGPPPDPLLTARQTLFSEAMRPAQTTDHWRLIDDATRAALDGVVLMEAPDEAAEARAIAVAMRDALAAADTVVALATPDRALAQRVAAELERFGILANDSAGRPLGATPPGELARLALEAALRPGDPVVLISLLKHPLTRMGLDPAAARRGARAIELVALRGGTGVADAAELPALYARRLSARQAQGRRMPRAVRLLGADDLALGQRMAEGLAAALQPLIALRHEPALEVGPQARALTLALEALAAGTDGAPDVLYAEEAGIALADWLRGLIAAPSVEFPFSPDELPDVAAALMTDMRVAPRGGLSRRVFIWGALEARLQHADTLILGGLNEGSWPQAARADAFLSRLMRAEILLDPPERRIGLAAHDIWMSLGSRRLVLSRAERKGGAPAIASRWLQRLLAVADEAAIARARQDGAAILSAAARLDRTAEAPRHPRPEPRPPLAARPATLSVTEVERLVRDPYAVHARRILHLEPLEPLIRAPGAAERGTLFHDILARAVALGISPQQDDALERLLAAAREGFTEANLPPEVEAVWWPRMEAMAARYLDWERSRDERVAARIAEAGGRHAFADLGITLTGYADRIDIQTDGSAEIIDFKTGTEPSIKQARSLMAPQLPLEGAMLRLGAFEGIPAQTPLGALTYVRLRERDLYEEGLDKPGTARSEAISVDMLADDALARFRGLAAAYRNPDKGYLSRARPFRAGVMDGDYDHLARAREWAVVEDGGEDEA
ncbi:double-strand break repair protein AddB [Aureimonas frigidaquae]|uniref:PD-(D/E)XK endonuclease-like domain-containing protein n=1 Tax=Aureimonas frigidaquae TaxID=424757 RepID=A0A0P0YZU4_9HYPH|nr:double-strand break repair protein AddB [Aureimonas frigidaquae]BAT27181.1 hypothetical protein [Aureimonas frigidaquae]